MPPDTLEDMTRWEYLAIGFDQSDPRKPHTERWSLEQLAGMHLSQGLNHLGAQGWELLQVVQEFENTAFYFKRSV
jgi:hypothetical protein